LKRTRRASPGGVSHATSCQADSPGMTTAEHRLRGVFDLAPRRLLPSQNSCP
jgi:hypothetical protein